VPPALPPGLPPSSLLPTTSCVPSLPPPGSLAYLKPRHARLLPAPLLSAVLTLPNVFPCTPHTTLHSVPCFPAHLPWPLCLCTLICLKLLFQRDFLEKAHSHQMTEQRLPPLRSPPGFLQSPSPFFTSYFDPKHYSSHYCTWVYIFLSSQLRPLEESCFF
jgi:hypothetical protein